MVSLILSACSGGASNACSRVEREAVADDSQLHVIPTADIAYASDPPTSGPHAPGPLPGIYVRTLSGPEQVGVLERGDVVIQFRPEFVSGTSLGTLVTDRVVLMPNPALGPDIVVTAWAHRMECKREATADGELTPISVFISERTDQGPTAAGALVPRRIRALGCRRGQICGSGPGGLGDVLFVRVLRARRDR